MHSLSRPLKVLLQALLLCYSSLSYSQTTLPVTNTPNGRVHTLTTNNDTLFVGGDFGNVGRYTGQMAMVSTTSDLPDTSYPRGTNKVVASTADGQGGFYFVTVDNVVRHLLFNKTIDSAFQISILTSGRFNEILFHNGIIYAAGSAVSTAGNPNPGSLLAINTTTGTQVTTIPLVDNNVEHIFIFGGKLYLSGNFTSVGNQARPGIAAIRLTDHALTSWLPNNACLTTGGYGRVTSYGDQLIVCGSFRNSCTNIPYKCIVADTVTGAVQRFLIRECNDNNHNCFYWAASVYQMTTSNNHLFIYTIGTYDTRLSVVNLATDSVVWTRFFNMIGSCYGMAVVGNSIYLGGWAMDEMYIRDSTGGAHNVELRPRNLVKLNATTGAIENWHPDLVGYLETMSVDGSNIFLGGDFSHLQGQDKPSGYQLHTGSDEVLPFKIDAYGFEQTNSSFIIGDTLLLAGEYASAWNTGIKRTLRCVNVHTGQDLPIYLPYIGQALAVTAYGNFIFVGGNLTDTTGGITKTNLIAINRQTGQVINWAPNPDWYVRCLHIADGRLYVGGAFRNISGHAQEHLAVYDLATFNMVLWPAMPNSTVNAIASTYNTIWVGGNFSNVGNVSSASLAGINKYTGLLTKSTGNVIHGEVKTILIKGRRVVAGGNFAYNGACKNIAVFDKESGAITNPGNFCTEFNPYSSVNTLALQGTNLYAGGDFLSLNNDSKAHNIVKIAFPFGYFDDGGDSLSYYPKSGGNGGSVTVSFEGSYIKRGMRVKLVAAGMNDIVPDTTKIYFPEPFKMDVLLDLKGTTTGLYDVIVTDTNGVELKYLQGFLVEPSVAPKLWVSLSGDPMLRIGFNQVYTVTYGNTGNVDAELVPLLISGLPLGTDIEVLTPTLRIDSLPGFNTLQYSLDSFRHTHNDSLAGMSYRMFYISRINATTTGSVHFIFHLPLNTSLNTIATINAALGAPLPGEQDDLSHVSMPQGYKGTALPDYLKFGKCFTSVMKLGATVLSDFLHFEDIENCAIGTTGALSSLFYNYTDRRYGEPNSVLLDAGDGFSSGWALAKDCLKAAQIVLPQTALLKAIDMGVKAASYGLGVNDIYQNCSKKATSDRKSLPVGNSWDPNEKYGPGDEINGYFINDDKPVTYTINFENSPAANLNAQTIIVTDSLTRGQYDYSSFAFTSVVLGDKVYSLSQPAKSFVHDFDLIDKYSVKARITATFDEQTGVAQWQFLSIDPLTDQVTTNPALGIVPPDTLSPLGQGYVSFIVKPDNYLGTNGIICNKASIVFDNNPSITTKCWQNTIDKVAPLSRVDSLPAIIYNEQFTVSWSGSDNLSGIKAYDIYVSVNGSSYKLWRSGASGSSGLFEGSFGNKYAFYSIATDKAGNREAVKNKAESVVVLTNKDHEIKVYPNPSPGAFTIQSKAGNPILNISLFDLQGRSIAASYTIMGNQGQVEVNQHQSAGLYLLKIETKENTYNQKIIISNNQ